MSSSTITTTDNQTRRRITPSDLVLIYAATVLDCDVLKPKGSYYDPQFHGLKRWESAEQQEYYAQMEVLGNPIHKDIRQRVVDLIKSTLDTSGWTDRHLFDFGYYFKGLGRSRMDNGIGNDYVLFIIENEYRSHDDPEYLLTVVKRIRESLVNHSIVVTDLRSFFAELNASHEDLHLIAQRVQDMAESTYRLCYRTDPDGTEQKREVKLSKALDFWITYLRRQVHETELIRANRGNEEAAIRTQQLLNVADVTVVINTVLTENIEEIKNSLLVKYSGAVNANHVARTINGLLPDKHQVREEDNAGHSKEYIAQKIKQRVQNLDPNERAALIMAYKESGSLLREFFDKCDNR